MDYPTNEGITSWEVEIGRGGIGSENGFYSRFGNEKCCRCESGRSMPGGSGGGADLKEYFSGTNFTGGASTKYNANGLGTDGQYGNTIANSSNNIGGSGG